MRSPRFLPNPSHLSFFLYTTHYTWDVGEASGKFVSFLDPIGADFAHNNALDT